jgi:hypothetical protein
MTSWKTLYLLGRVIGYCFTIIGGIFSLWGLSLVLDQNSTIKISGIPNNDPWMKAIVLIVSLVICGLGVLLIMSRRYRPDLSNSVEK